MPGVTVALDDAPAYGQVSNHLISRVFNSPKERGCSLLPLTCLPENTNIGDLLSLLSIFMTTILLLSLYNVSLRIL